MTDKAQRLLAMETVRLDDNKFATKLHEPPRVDNTPPMVAMFES